MLWINIWRAIVFVICAASLIIMTFGFIRHHKSWNEKTLDYWYGRIMWVVAAMVLVGTGIPADRPFRISFIFVTAAVLATIKGNLQKGAWGNPEPRERAE